MTGRNYPIPVDAVRPDLGDWLTAYVAVLLLEQSGYPVVLTEDMHRLHAALQGFLHGPYLPVEDNTVPRPEVALQ